MLCFGEIKGAKNFVKCREFMNIALPYEINIIKNFVMKILNFIRQNNFIRYFYRNILANEQNNLTLI